MRRLSRSFCSTLQFIPSRVADLLEAWSGRGSEPRERGGRGAGEKASGGSRERPHRVSFCIYS